MSLLNFKGYTRRRLLASVKLGLAAIPFIMAIRLAHGNDIVPGTFLLSFGAGFFVGIAELFVLKNWLRNQTFPIHILGKSLTLVGILYLTFILLELLDVVIEGITWQHYFMIIFDRETFIGLLELFGVIIFLLFFVNLDRLLGPGILLGYLTGRYYRPRPEQRIFMFLDLKGSTELADKMQKDQYFNFLHRYFTEMSEPILETRAEIYQYVGDEVVLTWKMKDGIEETNCIRLFFLIEAKIESSRSYFQEEFGVIPEFKAGVHAGEVISAQIGELKTEIVYNGDVLNVAARIQALCNEMGQKLLVSSELIDKLSPGKEFEIVKLGATELRGKTEKLQLCAVKLNTNK